MFLLESTIMTIIWLLVRAWTVAFTQLAQSQAIDCSRYKTGSEEFLHRCKTYRCTLNEMSTWNSGKMKEPLTFFHRFVLDAFPFNMSGWDEGADGDVPACSVPQTSVTSLLPTKVMEAKISAFLCYSYSVVARLLIWNKFRNLHQQLVSVYYFFKVTGGDFHPRRWWHTDKKKCKTF